MLWLLELFAIHQCLSFPASKAYQDSSEAALGIAIRAVAVVAVVVVAAVAVAVEQNHDIVVALAAFVGTGRGCLAANSLATFLEQYQQNIALYQDSASSLELMQ